MDTPIAAVEEQTESLELQVQNVLATQRAFFKSHQTKNIDYRKASLKRLKKELILREPDIIAALFADFRKSEFESVATEIGMVMADLNLAIKKLKGWSAPKRVFPSMLNFPSTAKIYYEPYGTVLNISPWNYPFQLAMAPLIAAIAAGNTCVLKPSELTPHTSKIVEEICGKVFPEEHVKVLQGAVEMSQALLKERWDYIFFTGSVGVGKIVAKAAANYLTPTTLELGGKNPCIVDDTANIKLAAKRIVWGKFLNGGQTCIAPDYVIVQAKAKHDLVVAMKQEITKAYGTDPKASEDFPRIINKRNFDRLNEMLQGEQFLAGGETEAESLYISPTLIDDPSLDSKVMEDEIFGPILPIVSYDTEADIDQIFNSYDKPLSLYVFSKDSDFSKEVIKKHSFGGGAINDTIIYFVNHHLPFGGVGNSGIGAYHGKFGFDTFSHSKPMVKRGNWIDVPVRYAPYKGKLKALKTLLKYF